MEEIKNTNIQSESEFSSVKNITGNSMTSQGSVGTSADITSIVVVAEKNGMPISARHFNIEKGKLNKIALGAEMLASLPDRVIFDIKVNSSIPANESGFGGSYALGDPPVIFSIPPNSPLTLPEMYSMVGTSQSRGIVAVTLAPLWRKGYFPFDMSINLVDPNTPGRISTTPKPAFEVYAEPRAGNFFDSLDVEIREGENNKTLSIIENRREEIQEILRTESTDPANCGKPCIYHIANLDTNIDAGGNVTDVDLNLEASADLAPSYKGFIVEDGVYSEPLTSRHNYRGNIFKQISKISMSLYNFDNQLYAYDQLVARQLLSVGSNENRVHPLIEVSDPFYCLEGFGNPSIPLMEFKTDLEIQPTLDGTSFVSRMPYIFAINAARVKSTNNIANIFNFSVPNVENIVSFSIQILKDKNRSVRQKNDVGIICTTSIGSGSNLRTFTNLLRVKTRYETDSIGSHVTYGSGDNLEDMGWPHSDITIGDLYYLISNNIAGTVNGELDSNISINEVGGYRGGQACNGLIPTFSECGIVSPTPYAPIISVVAGDHLSACYGLPAHRMWLGNTDGSIKEALVENLNPSIQSNNGSPILQIFSRGPEKSFNLNKYSLAMPISRGSGRAFMRQSIKSYEQHANDGDFESIRANRYYPLRSIADSVYFIRNGSDDAAKKYQIPDRLKSYLYPNAIKDLSGQLERRPCIGTSKIGVSVNFSGGNAFHPHRFYEEVGSYFMSCMSQSEPYRITNASIGLKISKIARNSMNSIFICYSPGRMFNSPRSGISYNPANDYVNNSVPTIGGEWHALYSTLTNDFFGGIKYNDPGISKYDALNPFIHDHEASLKSEGGLDGSSRRKVYINPCIDFRGYGLRINASNVGEDLNEFCKSTGRLNGNVQRFVNSDDYGSIGIPVTGSISCSMNILSSYPYENFTVKVNNSNYKVYENKFGNLIETINDVFGWSISYTPTATLAREDPIPFDKLRLELLKRPTPPVEPEPYGIEPYGFDVNPDEPYISYYNKNTSKINIDEIINSPYIDPYYDPYVEPYVEPYYPTPNPPPRYSYAQVLLRSRRSDSTDCNLGYIPVISISNMIYDSRYFDFNLSDRKNRTVANLVRSIEDRMASFGVHARSAVVNPESFISKNILPKPRTNILDTVLSVITETEQEFIPVPTPGNYDSEPYIEPYIDPYDAIYNSSLLAGFSLKKLNLMVDPYWEASYDPYANKRYRYDPYSEPYIGEYNYNIIKKPKPVFNVNTGISIFDVAVETVDQSYSGGFALDFDFNVSRRSAPSNSAPSNPAISDQRPRNDPAVRSLITGNAFSSSTPASTVSNQSVNSAANPSIIIGENGSGALAGSGSEEIRNSVNDIIRRRQ